MKIYEKPEINIIKFEVGDVIAASSVNADIDGGVTDFIEDWLGANVDGGVTYFVERWLGE